MMQPARSSQNTIKYPQNYTRLHATLHPEDGGGDPPKGLSLSTKPHGVTYQLTVIFTAIVKTLIAHTTKFLFEVPSQVEKNKTENVR
jgi:hypothetical protein